MTLIPLVALIGLAGCHSTGPAEPQAAILEAEELTAFEPVVLEQFLAACGDLLDGITESEAAAAWQMGQCGRTLHAYRFFEEAERAYDLAHQQQPLRFEWLYLLGQVQRHQKQFEPAIANLEQALSIEPDHLAARLALGDACLSLGQIDRAQRQFLEALMTQPDDGYARYGLARTLMARDQHEEAIHELNRVLDEQPQAHQVHLHLAMAYQALRRTEQAQLHQQAIPEDSFQKISIQLDDPLMQSIANLRIGAQPLLRKAQRALRQGQPQLALNWLRRALAANPQRDDIRYTLALTQHRLNQNQAAIDQLQHIQGTASVANKARLLQAKIEIEGNQLAQARRRLDEVLNANPDDGQARFQLGRWWRIQGEYALALEEFSRSEALGFTPHSSSWAQIRMLTQLHREHDTLAKIRDHLSRWPNDTAATAVEARLALDPDSDSIPTEASEPLSGVPASLFEVETRALALAQRGHFPTAVVWQMQANDWPQLRPIDRVRIASRLADLQAETMPSRLLHPAELSPLMQQYSTIDPSDPP